MSVRDTLNDNSPHKYYSNIYFNKVLKKYKIGVVSFPKIEPQTNDIYYTIKQKEAYRPEKISLKFYQTADLYWVICKANNIRSPLMEFFNGRTIVIPDPEYIFTTYIKLLDGVINE